MFGHPILDAGLWLWTRPTIVATLYFVGVDCGCGLLSVFFNWLNDSVPTHGGRPPGVRLPAGRQPPVASFHARGRAGQHQ